MIHPSNIESYIIDYLDGELNEADTQLLLTYLEDHPEYMELLESFKAAYINPNDLEDIEIPSFDHLIKTSSQPRLLKFWIALGMAASTLVAGLIWMLPSKEEKMINQSISQTPNITQPHNTQTNVTVSSNISNLPVAHSIPVARQPKKTVQTLSSIDSDAIATVAKVSSSSIQTIPIIEDAPSGLSYHIEVEVMYVQVPSLIKNYPTETSTIDVGIAGQNFEINTDRIEKLTNKLNDYKTKITDNIAHLPRPEFNFFK